MGVLNVCYMGPGSAQTNWTAETSGHDTSNMEAFLFFVVLFLLHQSTVDIHWVELFPGVKLNVIRTSIDIRANSWVKPSILSELALWASPKYARHTQASAPCKLLHSALHLFPPKSSSPCFYLSCLRSLVMPLDPIHPSSDGSVV